MTMLLGGRSPTGARRTVIIILMVGFAIVGLSRVGGGPERTLAVEQPASVTSQEVDPRGPEHLMVVSGLEMLQRAVSFRFMYASGDTWTSGEFVGPDRVDQRVIVGRTNTAPMQRVRRIGGEVWVRSSLGDEWASTDVWAVPADPFVLSENALVLAEAARDVHLADRPGVAKIPSGGEVFAHRLRGMVQVASLARVGLMTAGKPPEGTEVRFEMLVERESGLPVEILFHGIPPALPPLAVLHVFDHNSLEAESVVEPQIRVDSDDEDAVEDHETPSSIPGGAAATVTLPDTARVVSSEGLVGPGDEEDVEEVYVERTAEGEAGAWVRYVLPTEGYSIAAPTDWVVTPGRDGQEVSDGRLDGIHGADSEGDSRWSVYRMTGRGALLSLGQRRVEAVLRDPAVDPDSLSVTTVDLPVGPAIRVEYHIGSDPTRLVREFIVVRGTPALSSNLGYNIELSSASDKRQAQLDEIVATFLLLGAGP